MADAPIFIVGCPRSGTGLLRNLLRSHPRLTFPGESHFLVDFYQVYGDPKDDRAAYKLAKAILDLQWVKAWNIDLSPASLTSCRGYVELVSKVYEAWARQQNKPRWGDKTPQYVVDIPVLLGLFPNAKIIHIIRDGRDVALSWLRVNFGPCNLFTAATEWKRFVTTGRAHGTQLSAATYMEVRYESLLAAPQETLRSVCAFIDETYHEEMLTPSQFRRRFREPIFGSPKAKIGTTEIVAGNAGKWKARMGPRTLMLFESVAGDLLSELGYAVHGRTRVVSAPERVCWRMDHNLRWLLGRINSRGITRWFKTDLMLSWAGFRANQK